MYVVINGPLNMSAGKIAAQVFQAAQRLFANASYEQAELLRLWQEHGTCTRVRIAQTPAVFDRACRELYGVAMVDEGFNEVEPDTTTCFATYPIDDRKLLPRILRHKRCPVLNAEVAHVSSVRPPAREAELDQQRLKSRGTSSAKVLALGEAKVAGSNPAARLASADKLGRPSKGVRAPGGGEGQTSPPLQI